jgi:ribosome-associated protein
MNEAQLIQELQFKAVRSSGPGGQHVNKTASKVELRFSLETSEAFSDAEKQRLLQKLGSRLTAQGELILYASDSRSQHRNKILAIERLLALIKEHLKVQKKRKKTKPSKGAIEKRLKTKKQNALKKANRKPPTSDA